MLLDPTWRPEDSDEARAERASVVWDALAVGRRDDVVGEIPELVRAAIERYESRFPDAIDRVSSVEEWVMRDRPNIATRECRFCRKVLAEYRRARATGFSIDAEPWLVERGDTHGERCAIGVLAGLIRPRRVSQTVARTRAQLARLPIWFELDHCRGDLDYDVQVTIFGGGFASRRVEVFFGEYRARIVKRVSDRELRVIQAPVNSEGWVPVRVQIDGASTQLRQWYNYPPRLY